MQTRRWRGSWIAALALSLSLLAAGDAHRSDAVAPWHIATIATFVPEQFQTSSAIAMAADSSGRPIFAYVTDGDATVVRCDDAACTTKSSHSIESGIAPSAFMAMVVDNNDLPVLAYRTLGSPRRTHIARCSDVACATAPTITEINPGNTTIDPGHDFGAPEGTGSDTIAMRLNSSGVPILAYQVAGALQVLFCGDATCSAGNIERELDFDIAHTYGFRPSMVLDAGDIPVISSHDASSARDLRFLRCGNATCTAGNTVKTIEAPGDVGRHSAIGLTAPGANPWIAYSDNTNSRLRIGHCSDPVCTSFASREVAPLSVAAFFGVLAMTFDGDRPVMAYRGTGQTSTAACTDAACDDIVIRQIEPFAGSRPHIVRSAGGFAVGYERDNQLSIRLASAEPGAFTGLQPPPNDFREDATVLSLGTSIATLGELPVAGATISPGDLPSPIPAACPGLAGAGHSVWYEVHSQTPNAGDWTLHLDTVDTDYPAIILALGPGDTVLGCFEAAGDFLRSGPQNAHGKITVDQQLAVVVGVFSREPALAPLADVLRLRIGQGTGPPGDLEEHPLTLTPNGTSFALTGAYTESTGDPESCFDAFLYQTVFAKLDAPDGTLTVKVDSENFPEGRDVTLIGVKNGVKTVLDCSFNVGMVTVTHTFTPGEYDAVLVYFGYLDQPLPGIEAKIETQTDYPADVSYVIPSQQCSEVPPPTIIGLQTGDQVIVCKIEVAVHGDTSSIRSATCTITGGDAIEGLDYKLDGSLNIWPSGNSDVKFCTLIIYRDVFPEGTEAVTLGLIPTFPSGGFGVGRQYPTTTILIANDPAAYTPLFPLPNSMTVPTPNGDIVIKLFESGPKAASDPETRFAEGTVVTWDGLALATDFIDSDTLHATVPADLLQVAGVHYLWTYDPSDGTTSALAPFWLRTTPAADMDCDEAVTLVDAVSAARGVTGLPGGPQSCGTPDPSGKGPEAVPGDGDYSGVFDADDIRYILRVLVGTVPE